MTDVVLNELKEIDSKLKLYSRSLDSRDLYIARELVKKEINNEIQRRNNINMDS